MTEDADTKTREASALQPIRRPAAPTDRQPKEEFALEWSRRFPDGPVTGETLGTDEVGQVS